MPAPPYTRVVVRTVVIVVVAALTLYLIYLLRTPLTWLVIAGFIAVATAGPVAYFSRWMRRGLAIALVYLLLLLVPILLGALIIPPMVSQAEELADNVPEYVNDLQEFVNENETLANLNEDYDIVGELESLAQDLPSRIGDAAAVLRDIGVGVVNSIFAGVTILILSVFMVGGGPRWRERILEAQPPERAARMRRAFDHIASAVGNYVGGALLQATIAGFSAFIVLEILGAPFAAPLALLVAIFDLIPVVGATIAAFLVAIVMIFVNFPVGLIVWVIYAIVYQQVENYVIQPQIQRRAVAVEPFVQIAVREWLEYRREARGLEQEGGYEPPSRSAPEPAA
jgi:predicted PurR-regulated permease PerM